MCSPSSQRDKVNRDDYLEKKAAEVRAITLALACLHDEKLGCQLAAEHVQVLAMLAAECVEKMRHAAGLEQN